MTKKPIKLVLMGSLGVAVEGLEWLLSLDEVEVLGVVCSQKPKAKWRKAVGDRDMQEAARTRGIPILTLEDLLDIEADLGLSIRFHEILRERHLQRFRLGVINLHGAPLPEMRGSMCDAAAILENRSEFGTSLHWMDTGIDSGDILAVHRFPISDQDTVYDLFKKSNDYGFMLIKNFLLDIAAGKIKGQSQEEAARRLGVTPKSYFAKEVIRLKEIDHGLRKRDLWNTVRAFQFPGHEPAFLQTPLGKIHLTVSPSLKEDSHGKSDPAIGQVIRPIAGTA